VSPTSCDSLTASPRQPIPHYHKNSAWGKEGGAGVVKMLEVVRGGVLTGVWVHSREFFVKKAGKGA
jgi:hypothetical protein